MGNLIDRLTDIEAYIFLGAIDSNITEMGKNSKFEDDEIHALLFHEDITLFICPMCTLKRFMNEANNNCIDHCKAQKPCDVYTTKDTKEGTKYMKHLREKYADQIITRLQED